MSAIPTNFLPLNLAGSDTGSKTQTPASGASDFEALLSHIGDSKGMHALIDEFMDHLSGATSNENNPLSALGGSTSGFPFTSAFESTFGTTGPLPDFIARITAKLQLNTAQNQALQDIAVRNKDITRSAADRAKIAAELKQAGIG